MSNRRSMMFSLGGSSYDADAQAFLTATGITDLTISDAINDLVIGYKSAGLWTKRSVIYPFVGGTVGTHKFNLKNPVDSDSANRIAFSGGLTHSSTGVLPNGTNGYGDTFLVKDTSNLVSFGFYSRTEGINSGYDMGAIKTPSTGYNALILWQTSTVYLISNAVGNSQLSVSSLATSKGWFLANFNGTAVEGFHQGIKKTGTSSFPSSDNPVSSFKLFCLQYDNGFREQFAGRESAFAVIGSNISEAEALAEYNLIQTFQTALGRNV